MSAPNDRWSDEDLSRLLDAELDHEQATALRQDIDTDPALAARWEAMLGLDADLSALNDTPAPAHLDAAILENAPVSEVTEPPAPPSKTWAYVLLAAGLLLAATPLLALTDWAKEPTELAVASGSQWVQGPALVLLPDGQSVAVKGRALISVEPASPLPRVWEQEDEMNPKILLAAAAGAAITVAVYEGSAVLDGPGGEVEIQAGDSHSTPARPPKAGPADTPPRMGTQTGPEAALPPQVQAELDKLRLQNQFLEGQLAANGIRPNAWPEILDPQLEPETFEEKMAARLADFPGVELVEVECSEYPCVAIFEDTEQASPENMEAFREATLEGFEGQFSSSVMGGAFQNGQDAPERYYEIWALSQGDVMADADRQRLDTRVQDLFMDIRATD